MLGNKGRDRVRVHVRQAQGQAGATNGTGTKTMVSFKEDDLDAEGTSRTLRMFCDTLTL